MLNLNEVFLTNEEIRRYSRHLLMPEGGLTGQKKLKAASVLLTMLPMVLLYPWIQRPSLIHI